MTLWILAAVALAGFLLWLEPISKEDAKRRANQAEEVATRANTGKADTARGEVKPPESKPGDSRPATPKTVESKPPEQKASPTPAPAGDTTASRGQPSATPAKEGRAPAPRAEAPGEKSAEATLVERAFTPPGPASKPLFAMPPKVSSRDLTQDEEASAKAKPQDKLALNRETAHTAAPAPPAPKAPPGPSTEPVMARAAIVIDDFGPDIEAARKFLALPIQLTFSVMPFETHSREICELVHSQGHEVILHLPMEPQSFPAKKHPAHMLTLGMKDEAMRKFISQALFTTPYITGVNNHQGSRFTESVDAMDFVISELRTHGLYFFDSRTSPKSVGAAVARKRSVPTGQRDIFLDHSQTESFVRSQMDLLIRKARIEGSAIAIGHPHAVTLKVLTESLNRFRADGVQIVPLGELMTTRPPSKPAVQVPLGRD